MPRGEDDGAVSCISVTPNAPALGPVGTAIDKLPSGRTVRNSEARASQDRVVHPGPTESASQAPLAPDRVSLALARGVWHSPLLSGPGPAEPPPLSLLSPVCGFPSLPDEGKTHQTNRKEINHDQPKAQSQRDGS